MTAQAPELEAFVLCDSTAKDGATGKVTLMGIFDRIWVHKTPAVHGQMAMYFRFRMEQNSMASVNISVKAPSGLAQETPNLQVRSNPQGICEGAIDARGFPLPDVGQYNLGLYVNGKKMGSYVLHVLPVQQNDATVH